MIQEGLGLKPVLLKLLTLTKQDILLKSEAYWSIYP